MIWEKTIKEEWTNKNDFNDNYSYICSQRRLIYLLFVIFCRSWFNVCCSNTFVLSFSKSVMVNAKRVLSLSAALRCAVNAFWMSMTVALNCCASLLCVSVESRIAFSCWTMTISYCFLCFLRLRWSFSVSSRNLLSSLAPTSSASVWAASACFTYVPVFF